MQSGYHMAANMPPKASGTLIEVVNNFDKSELCKVVSGELQVASEVKDQELIINDVISKA